LNYFRSEDLRSIHIKLKPRYNRTGAGDVAWERGSRKACKEEETQRNLRMEGIGYKGIWVWVKGNTGTRKDMGDLERAAC
jgi:hypothetical protein